MDLHIDMNLNLLILLISTEVYWQSVCHLESGDGFTNLDDNVLNCLGFLQKKMTETQAVQESPTEELLRSVKRWLLNDLSSPVTSFFPND